MLLILVTFGSLFRREYLDLSFCLKLPPARVLVFSLNLSTRPNMRLQSEVQLLSGQKQTFILLFASQI
jgi:hypothetical protein